MFNNLKSFFSRKEDATRASYMVLLAFASAALIAAFTLSVEKIHLLKEPDAVLSCSFNVVLNCSAVMQTWQASVFFGIPNMYIGLVAFSILVAVAVGFLFGGARYNKGFLKTMNVGILLGTIFAYWLFFQSLYAIQVLCPWCLAVTVSCTFMLAAATHITLRDNLWGFAKKLNDKIQRFLKAGYHKLVVASWLVLMVALVFMQFGTALFS